MTWQGGLTMAERDTGSTVVYPPQELYRPSMVGTLEKRTDNWE